MGLAAANAANAANAAKGASASAGAPPLAAAECTRLLRQLDESSDLPDKPRNVLGFAKDVPATEMAARLKARIAAGVDAMRELALRRGIAARDALVAKDLPSARLFLAAPKLRAPGEPGGAGAQRALSAGQVSGRAVESRLVGTR